MRTRGSDIFKLTGGGEGGGLDYPCYFVSLFEKISPQYVTRLNFPSTQPHQFSLLSQTPSSRATISVRYKYSGPSNVGKFVLRGSKVDVEILKDSPSVDISSISWDPSTAPATDIFEIVYFPVVGDGTWRTTYANFQVEGDPDASPGSKPLVRVFNETLTQIRMYPVAGRPAGTGFPASLDPIPGSSFHVDWIRLSNSPAVTRVTGCNGETYSSTSTFEELVFEVEQVTEKVNLVLDYHWTDWKRRRQAGPSDTTTTFARSYNCLRGGGDVITVEGRNFGEGGIDGRGSPAVVLIGGNPCTDVIHDTAHPQTKLTCITPSMTNSDGSDVQVLNGQLPGLNDTVPYFEYAVHPPAPKSLQASNNAATSIDLSWEPDGTIWDAMAVTGYAIYWRESGDADWSDSRRQVVGNITTTTLINLAPNTLYEFTISAATENQNDPQWLALDKYGRRSLLDGGLLGQKATLISSQTLTYDFNFAYFDASSTLDSGADATTITTGPTGVLGGEGHYGLHLIGDANVENCNSSYVCCDSYDPLVGSASCGSSMTCSVSMTVEAEWTKGLSTRRIPDNLPGGDKRVDAANTIDKEATMKCGPALRLTASSPRLTGAAWYAREVEVGEGFDTTFTFRLANPSLRCNFEDGVHTNCRSRGGDGFAFVLQSSAKTAIGNSGQGLGYGGIVNSLAVEFDTYFNADLLEPYENHVSVHTRGWREDNSPEQTYSLGQTNEVPDLSDGEIEVRIMYEPNLNEELLFDPRFASSPFVAHFLENADFANGGMADWGVGLGLLQIFVGNLADPVLIVPLSLEETLHLNHGRSWVGFTSATGLNTWQVHDLLDWHFTSLRHDKKTSPAIMVNQMGSFGCSGVDDPNKCVHT